MAKGSLLLPLGYAPLHPTTGALVPNGKLQFFRAGTTTEQDTFSDSTLDTENANPVVLNAAGVLTTLVYGDPDSGFDYRVRLYDEDDVLLQTWDDVVCALSDVATIQEGSFTGTLTGMDAPTTGTVSYRVTANAAGTGKICRLYLAAGITGTSNTTAMTLTGLPAACTPSVPVYVVSQVRDNGGDYFGGAQILAAGTAITFLTGAPLSLTGFTNSGTKGLGGGWTIEYQL